MTAKQLEQELEVILASSGAEVLPEFKTDFRRLTVRYLCKADGNETLCKRYAASPAGCCTYRMIERCMNNEVH